MSSFGASVVVGYLLLVGGLFLGQRYLIYRPFAEPFDPAQVQASGLKPVTVETADGLSLTHLYRAPAVTGGPVVVVFHGNAGHIGYRVPKFVEFVEAGLGLFLVEYRGFGGNPGKPSEEGLYADARAALDWLAEQGVAAERTVLYGESLGSAVAVAMAAERPAGAVVLEAPFTSLAEVAQHIYWFTPAKWLVLDRFDSLSRIRKIAAPLLIVHGERDQVVPVKFGRELFAAAPEPKEAVFLPAADHVDLFDYGVERKIIEFIGRRVTAAVPEPIRVNSAS